MNKPLTADELAKLAVPAPELETKKPMTRRERLMRWADLIRASYNFYAYFFMFHGLERYNRDQLMSAIHPCSVFSIAANDPVFVAEGLTGPSAAHAMTFFELSQADLHEFSCDCGGAISGSDMARRIEFIATRGDCQTPIGLAEPRV